MVDIVRDAGWLATGLALTAAFGCVAVAGFRICYAFVQARAIRSRQFAEAVFTTIVCSLLALGLLWATLRPLAGVWQQR